MWSVVDLLRRDPEKIRWSQRRRNLEVEIVEEVLNYDKRWRDTLIMLNQLRHERNEISKQVSGLGGDEKRKTDQGLQRRSGLQKVIG